MDTEDGKEFPIMTTDYVMFIHGTNTRGRSYDPKYAEGLFKNIEKEVLRQAPSLHLKAVPLFWGNLNKEAEEQLRETYTKSDKWPHFWFQKTRNTLILQFIGDAALYLSRYVGGRIVGELKRQILCYLRNRQAGDRLHLVVHSLGEVILFDLLFSSRWELPLQTAANANMGQQQQQDPIPPQDEDCESHLASVEPRSGTPTEQVLSAQQDVMQIRTIFYGLEPNPGEGIRLASVHSMSSPLTLFSLIDVDSTEKSWPEITHDITPKLQLFLQNLARENQQTRLPWKNFAHPGDFLAYPLDPLLPNMVDKGREFLHVEDVITELHGLDLLIWPLRSTVLAMIDSVTAHTSYWQSSRVAKGIAESICSSV